MKYFLVMDEDKVAATFSGQGKAFIKFMNTFLLSGYGLKEVNRETYEKESETELPEIIK